MGAEGAGEAPVSLATYARSQCGIQGRSEFEKIANLGARFAPLFPVAHTHPAAQPVVDFRYRSVEFRDPEITHPAAKVLGKLLKPVLHGHEPASTGGSLDPSFELVEGFIRPPDLGFWQTRETP